MGIVNGEIFPLTICPDVKTLIAYFHFFFIQTLIQYFSISTSHFSFQLILDIMIVILIEHDFEYVDIFLLQGRI